METRVLILVLKQLITEIILTFAFKLGRMIGDIKITNELIKEVLMRFLEGIVKHVKNYIPTHMHKVSATL